MLVFALQHRPVHRRVIVRQAGQDDNADPYRL
ncbi:hypothetical protein X741_15560 [Mesorhizobium sp. LNHC229A00]|nr:hypothetical protein X741_15560 [Mesorhizobium sp. LNHC229A00]